MRAIYPPDGRAEEYSLLGLNPWGKSWCSHDCTYCYVSGMFHMSREQWRATPFKPRRNIVQLVRADAQELAGTDKRVLCCFAGDLYSPEAAATGISRQILEAFREFDVPFQVLTKGGMRAAVDFDLYGPNDAFATTMTFVSALGSIDYEPGAAWPQDRVKAIEEAHRRGIETWVSLEPVFHPSEALFWIDSLSDCADLFKVGKLNHDPERERQIDWRAFGIAAIAHLKERRKRYYIKDDLAKHLGGVPFTNTDTRRVIRP